MSFDLQRIRCSDPSPPTSECRGEGAPWEWGHGRERPTYFGFYASGIKKVNPLCRLKKCHHAQTPPSLTTTASGDARDGWAVGGWGRECTPLSPFTSKEESTGCRGGVVRSLCTSKWTGNMTPTPPEWKTCRAAGGRGRGRDGGSGNVRLGRVEEGGTPTDYPLQVTVGGSGGSFVVQIQGWKPDVLSFPLSQSQPSRPSSSVCGSVWKCFWGRLYIGVSGFTGTRGRYVWDWTPWTVYVSLWDQ